MDDEADEDAEGPPEPTYGGARNDLRRSNLPLEKTGEDGRAPALRGGCCDDAEDVDASDGRVKGEGCVGCRGAVWGWSAKRELAE